MGPISTFIKNKYTVPPLFYIFALRITTDRYENVCLCAVFVTPVCGPCQCQILSSVGGGALTGRNSNVSPPPPRGENNRDQRLRDHHTHQHGHASHLYSQVNKIYK